MIKIAVFSCAARHYGGSFQYAVSILEALSVLQRDQYEIRFWYTSTDWNSLIKKFQFQCIKSKKNSFFRRTFNKCLRTVNYCIKNESINYFAHGIAALYEIQRWKPDVCIRLEQGHIPLPPDIACIGPIHDLMHRYEPSFPEVAEKKEWASRELLFRYHATHAQGILVDSSIGKKHVIECYGTTPENIYVLPFVANNMLTKQAKKPESLSGLEDRPFIFYPAQFWLHKNHENLVKALALIKNKNICCAFSGSTAHEGYARCMDTIQALKLEHRVFILGYCKDEEVLWLYKNALCMVMPTFFGPTNIPPLEATQYGCPVAVSNIYGMPEQMENAALFFDPKNPREIANCIETIANDEQVRCKLISHGYALTKKWNEQEFKKKFISIIEEVIQKTI